MVPDLPPPLYGGYRRLGWIVGRCGHSTWWHWGVYNRCVCACVCVYICMYLCMYVYMRVFVLLSLLFSCLSSFFLHSIYLNFMCHLFMIIYLILISDIFIDAFHITLQFAFLMTMTTSGAKTADYFLHRVKSSYFLIPALFTIPCAAFMALSGMCVCVYVCMCVCVYVCMYVCMWV